MDYEDGGSVISDMTMQERHDENDVFHDSITDEDEFDDAQEEL